MNEIKLTNIIASYKHFKEKDADEGVIGDRLLFDCSHAKSLLEVIQMAATATGTDLKRHPHQRRISADNLALFAKCLLEHMDVIDSAKSFDELVDVIQGVAIRGIVELAVYDTAHRIGSYKGIFPDKVYLHSGTRIGAENLLGKICGPYILVIDLPDILGNSGLSAADLEDFFCHRKEDLKTCI